VAIASEMRGLRFGGDAMGGEEIGGALLDMVVAVFFGIVGRQIFGFGFVEERR
jgi:hypothetical protein